MIDAQALGELLVKALTEGRVIIQADLPATDVTMGPAAASRAAMPGDGLLTKGDVARRLGRSVRYVERLVKGGKLRKVPNLGARTTRFRVADIERLLVDREERPGRRRL